MSVTVNCWGWGGYAAFLDICEIEVDRSDNKGFVMLTVDITPNYTDTTIPRHLHEMANC